MTAPPVLTAERIDAMLSVMAEVCLEGVVEAGRRQKAAEDFEAFERGGRALQRACRNLRQTIAMKQRHDREQARKADDARKLADAARSAARQEHRSAVERRNAHVRRHFERVLWDEYEDDDAQELFDDVDDRLTELADAPDFLETPTETLIQRLAEEIGLGDGPAPEPAAKPLEDSLSAPPGLPAQAAGPTPGPAPPDPPPDPPPGPIPPWERGPPGRITPGGAGW